MTRNVNPLVDPPPAEIPLANAPLVRVIAQVQFPPIVSIERREFVATFQEAVRRDYPILREERAQRASIGPDGISAMASSPVVWRFSDITEDWRVSLSIDFLSLETLRYQSRSDFLERLGALLVALEAHIDPQVVDRFGVRYIDRITGEAVADIPKLVNPELLGVFGTPLAEQVVHTLTESRFQLPDCNLLARWGVLPPDAGVDLNAIEPVEEQSWILDLDLSTPERSAFDVNALVAQGERFSERAYTVFRWAVTDAFLKRYGGDLS